MAKVSQPAAGGLHSRRRTAANLGITGTQMKQVERSAEHAQSGGVKSQENLLSKKETTALGSSHDGAATHGGQQAAHLPMMTGAALSQKTLVETPIIANVRATAIMSAHLPHSTAQSRTFKNRNRPIYSQDQKYRKHRRGAVGTTAKRLEDLRDRDFSGSGQPQFKLCPSASNDDPRSLDNQQRSSLLIQIQGHDVPELGHVNAQSAGDSPSRHERPQPGFPQNKTGG